MVGGRETPTGSIGVGKAKYLGDHEEAGQFGGADQRVCVV